MHVTLKLHFKSTDSQ